MSPVELDEYVDILYKLILYDVVNDYHENRLIDIDYVSQIGHLFRARLKQEFDQGPDAQHKYKSLILFST